MNIRRISYKYHLFLSALSLTAGYVAIAFSMWQKEETIALNVFSVLVFWIVGTLCFLILPAAILAFSIMARFFCFIPFISGDYTATSTLLLIWAVINIASGIFSINGYDSEDEIGIFILN